MKKLLMKAKVAFILLCLGSLAMPVISASANVVISEIMYHPIQLLDEQYEYLELYNTGASTVDLTNWTIDGIGFTFSAGSSIGPGAYMVLAKDANHFQATYGFAPSYVYTGKISNSGELLRVLDANGISVDEVGYSTYPPWPVTPDELGPSLERINPTLNGNDPRNWHASIAPAKHTAGALNSVNAAALPPWISNVQHGTVQPATPLTVTASVEAANAVNLKYIINFGTQVIIPMYDNGLSGDGAAGDGVYGATIPAQPLYTLIRYRIDTTGPTGAMGFPRDDDSIVYSGTYIENDASVITGLPIFHWLIAPADYNNAVITCQTDVNYPALLYYDGTLYDGIKIHARGQTSRSWYKKSWKFKTAKNHDVFIPGLTGIPVDNFNLQASYSDKSYTREYLAWKLLADVGSPYSQYFPVRLYQNGQFFGLYAYYEDIDNNYMTRNGLDKDYGALYEAASDCSYYSLAQLPTYYQKHRPDDGDFNDLHNFLNGINNLTGQARRNFIFDNLNIPEVMNYLAALVTMHDNDAPAKNYYLYRDTIGTGRWWILPWDKDLTWGRNYQGAVLNDDIWANIDSISGRTNVSPSHPLFGDMEHEKYDYLWNRLIEVLYNETDFRNMFYRRLRTIMDEQLQAPGTPYAQRKFEKTVDELTAIENTEAAMDMSRWGSWGQYQTIDQAAQILKDSYLTVRRTHLFVTHRVAGEIPETQTATPAIIINEIMYNPAGGNDDEFIELYNPSSTESVDMSGWQLNGVELTMPSGTVLLPQSYLVVVKNDVQFRTTYGSGLFVAAQYNGSLDNIGENLVLKDSQGNIIDEVYYSSGGFWPTLSGGQSLELIDVSQNNNHPTNWAASASAGGTPCVVNSMAGTAPYIPALKVNEVLPVNSSINVDDHNEYAPWIEIYNASPNSVDLGGMFLTNDYNNPAKWAIPAGTTLNSGQWMIFWADAEPNEGPLHTNFALSSAGGSVWFYTAAGKIIDYLTYGPLTTNISYGKYPDGVAAYREFATPTPAAQNYIAPTPLILNEYNAVADNKYLKDNASDPYWGRVLGNGGDWFEMVVTQDHLDARGWQLVLNDNGVIKTLTMTSNSLWADLRSGTIITVSENLPDNLSNYDPANGKWWINVQAKSGASGTYITATNIDVSHNNWQLTIKNSAGTVVFGPAGEGIKTNSGIGSDEICHLEENPGPLITARSNYTDGSASTFGAPNIYTAGGVQDFSNLRSIPDAGAPAPNPMVWTIVPTTTSSTSITMIASAASDPTGIEYYFNNVTDPNHDSGWQDSTYYKDKNLSSNTTYTYRVKARDKSAAQNETVWSVTGSAITTSTPSLVTFVAAGAVASNTTAITPALPSGIAAGDILLLFLETSNQAISISNQNSGAWAEVTISPQATGTAAGSTGARLTVFWSRYNGTQGAPTTSDSGDHQLGRIVAFRGAAVSGDPWYVTAGGVEAASDTSGTIPGALTTVNNTLIVAAIATALPDAAGTANFSAWANSDLTNIAELTDNTVTAGNGGGLAIATGEKAAAGAYGNTTVTLASSAYKGMMSIALKPELGASTLPGQASSPSPATSATNVAIDSDLSWTAGSGTTVHDVYFGTNSSPGAGEFKGSQTGTTYDPGTLLNNTTYYWRVDEKIAGGTTTGTVWSFTTIVAPPSAASSPNPANTATNVSLTQDLSWSAGSGATSRDVYFGTVNPPVTKVLSDVTVLTYDTGTMNTSTTYYWRVDEKNVGGTTTGTVWSFTTVPPPPGPATNPTPSTGATNVSLTQDLNWTAGTGTVTSRDVYFGTVNPPVTKVLSDVTVLTYDTGTMNTSTTYYWRVDEKNTGGTTTGTVWSFGTVPPPPAPASSPSPSNGATNVGITTDLGWTAGSGATSGDVYFGTTNPPQFQINQAGITYDTGTMANNKTYYWRIDEKNTGGTTTGTVWSFITIASVPNVVGSAQADANSAIIGAGLVVGSITKQYSNSVAAGLVISQNPTSGTQINAGSSVNFAVSLGSPLITIMPLGDSITRGWYGSPYSRGYRKPLYDKLMTAGYSFDFVGSQTDGNFPDPNHEGHDGWHADTTGTNDILGQVYNWLTARPANIVLLHIGTNDIRYGGQNASEINSILNEIDRFSTDVKVVLALIINMREDANSSLRQIVTQFNQDVNAMAQNRIAAGDDIVVVNMENVLDYNVTGGDLVDLLHPNDNGYTKMADVWFAALDNILPPSFTSAPITTATVSQQYSYDVNAGGCPEPTYELIVCPNGMTIDHNTGLIEWLPLAVGDFNVTVNAGNGQMPDANQSFVIVVSNSVVPNVVGMTQADANAAIIDAGLVVGTIDYQCSDTVADGNVISQSPTGGTTALPGSSVNLVISSGQPSVPDVTGQAQATAIANINAVANISYGSSTTQCSDTVAAGNVISQSVTGITTCGTVVNLVISSGQPIVPDVTGQAEATAIANINAVANISYGSSSTQSSETVPAGDVISQSATGTVPCGTVVNLVVSSGPCSAVVPDVTGQALATAIANINAVANISYGSSTTECSDTVAAGNVISQSATGTVSCGTVVNLVISSGQSSVPDVTGQAQATAIANINAVANISYGSSTTQCSDTVAAGLVISQSATGTVTCGTVVNLVISSGQPSVPDVTGQVEATAIANINAVANISYGSSTTECSNTVAAGNVISQSVTGTTTCGTVVNLVISSGQPIVPDVVGNTEAAAIYIINSVANISYGSTTMEYSITMPEAYVISQSVTGTASCGTVVDLVISLGLPPATIQSNGTGGGNWNTGATWIGGIVPRTIDDVIIQGSDEVTLAAPGSCVSLTMNAGSKLTITAGGPIPGSSWSLDPASTIEFNTIVPNSWVNPIFGNLIFNIPNYSLQNSITVAGHLSILNNTLRGIGVTSGTNIHNIAGNVNISGTGRITGVNQSSTTTASCTWNIGGNLTLDSTSNRIQLYESAGPHLGSAVFNINGNLIVGATSQIMLKSSSASTTNYPEGIINLKGNLVQNGTIGVNSTTSGTSPGLSINFVGTSAQDWSGAALFDVTSFSVNMNINNAAGVTLSSPIKIHTNTVLILTNGKLTSTETNLLTIDKGSIIGGSPASYINGPLVKRVAVGTYNHEFPIGDATKYTPVNLAFGNVTDADLIMVSTTPGIHPQIAASGLDGSKTLNRYYTVTNIGSFHFNNVTVTFNFNPTDVIGGADPTKYVVKQFDTGTWTTPTTLNPSATSIQATGITSFSDFAIGELSRMTIFGHVTEPDANIPVEGVSIDASNGGGSDTTDANGYYELKVNYGWSGTVTLQKTGYTFNPDGKEYSNVTANQNDDYIATLNTPIIWGYVVDSATQDPISGVLMSPDNDGGSYTSKYHGGGSGITDADGYYEVVVDYNWSGNVVPSKNAYAFQPSSITYANVTEDIAEPNSYSGTLLTYKITGCIKNACQTPIAGVAVDANNGGNSDITDVNGYYEVWVDPNWSGTITPSKDLYTFDPNVQVYTVVIEDITDQNYAANNIYDLDCDTFIGYGDVAVMSEYWLDTGTNVPGDIHKDGDNIVNFLDFAEFADVWLNFR